MIKSYLKYLLSKKGKMTWMIAANLLIATICYFFFKEITDIVGDNGVVLVVFICVLITVIRVIVDLQPFMEWKDNYDKNKSK